jgi:ABC-type glycerol-3-phosphate transport system substrate-binding protein
MRKRVIGLAIVSAMTLSLFGAGAASAAGTTTLNVVHGIPGLDVAVCVDGVKAIKNFNPGEVVAGIELPSGRYDLAVVAKGTPCTAVVLGADNVGLWAGKNNTVVANLDAKGKPNLKIFGNNVSPTAAGETRLLIRHTAAAPAVNVWANGGKIISGKWFDWGSHARRDVPQGDYKVKVTLPGSKTAVIGPARLSVDAGTVYQVYAWGSGDAGYSFAIVPTVVGTV